MKRMLLVLALLFSATFAMADSPLTNTLFWTIYNPNSNVIVYPLYKTVDNNNGWGRQVMDILVNPELSVEQRLCVVNYIGWNIDGQHHFDELVDHYVKVQRYSSAKQAFAAMDGAMLTVFAYVRAMDDYYVVDDALRLADEAVRRSPVSRAAAMVQALIRGQQLTDDMTRWGDIYTACHRVETNAKLNHDLSPAAVNAIMEYINGYAE